jgi:Methyltransferase domain
MAAPCDSYPIARHLGKASELVGRVFSRGVLKLLRDPKAAADYWRYIARAALYPAQDAQKLLGLPRCKVDEIIPGAESIPVTLIDYQYAYGDMPIHELVVLCRSVRYRKPKVVFEIGTYLGGTTLQIAANSHAKVYTLDLPPQGQKEYVQPQIYDPELDVFPDHPGVRFQSSPYADRIHQLFGDSQTYDFTPYHGSVDLVFVDGCHHYESVLHDSQIGLKMVSANGIVMWHDYASYAPGVVRVLNELSRAVPLVHIVGTSLVVHHRGESC